MMTRLRALNESAVVMASHDDLHIVNLTYPEEEKVQWQSGRHGKNISRQVPLANVSSCVLDRGTLPTRAEIQAVDVLPSGEDHLIAAIDAHGDTTVTKFSQSSSSSSSSSPSSSSSSPKRRRISAKNTSYYLKSPQENEESGWNGVALSPIAQDNIVATCSFWGKHINILDYASGRCVRTMHAGFNPTQIQFEKGSGSKGLLAIAEGNMLSLWDARCAERGGCVHRVQTSSQGLYSMDVGDGLVAVAGKEKTVHVYDIRKNKMVGQWVKALKYEVMSVMFSSINQNYCYATGLDHEIFCGSWLKGGNMSALKRHGFRGDSRWLGIDRVLGSDTLLGMTDNYSLYVLKHPYRLVPGLTELP